MATVTLRAPLKDLAGGQTDVEVPGATVGEVIRALEAEHPKLARMDPRRAGPRPAARERLRERRTDGGGRGASRPTDRLHVLASISGGCTMSELLVGTKKGLFALRGEPGDAFEVAARAFAGEVVEFAMRDPRTGPVLRVASRTATTGRACSSPTTPAGEWKQADGPAFPDDSRRDRRADLGRSSPARPTACCRRASPRPRCSQRRTTARPGS